MNPVLRYFNLFALIILAMVGVVGCGGNGSGSSAKTGSATMQIIWPEETRLIPVAAKSIVVTLTNGTTVVATQTVARPTTGNTSTVTFSKVPASALVATSVAYPNSDGTGIAQARASTTMKIVADQTTTITLTMSSTIVEVEMNPAAVTIGLKATQQIVATPLDASGNTVLVATSKITWESSNESVATVSDTGFVTGLASGTTNITFTDEESGKVGTTTLTGSSTGGGSIVDLANTYITSLSTAQQTASVVSSSAANAAKWSDLAATPASDGTNSLRNGIAYSTLSTAQKTAFLNLAQAALGTTGYERLQQILASDDYLNDTDSD